MLWFQEQHNPGEHPDDAPDHVGDHSHQQAGGHHLLDPQVHADATHEIPVWHLQVNHKKNEFKLRYG